jgi:hypothetical protein
MKKNVIKFIRKKLETEPSKLVISNEITEEVEKSLNTKEKLWTESHINEDGHNKITKQLIEFDPSNIYIYLDLKKITVFFNTKSKSSAEFLAKNIYSQINKNK